MPDITGSRAVLPGRHYCILPVDKRLCQLSCLVRQMGPLETNFFSSGPLCYYLRLQLRAGGFVRYGNSFWGGLSVKARIMARVANSAAKYMAIS